MFEASVRTVIFNGSSQRYERRRRFSPRAAYFSQLTRAFAGLRKYTPIGHSLFQHIVVLVQESAQSNHSQPAMSFISVQPQPRADLEKYSNRLLAQFDLQLGIIANRYLAFFQERSVNLVRVLHFTLIVRSSGEESRQPSQLSSEK